jgi:16S rRNA G966 N2-methylase RsmD
VPKGNIILNPVDYLKLIKGERLQKKYSLEDIRQTALEMHETLRQIKVTERLKPIFIAGILIALEDKTFSDEYAGFTSFSSVITMLNVAIDRVLTGSDIKKDKIDNVKNAFKIMESNEKLKSIPLGHRNSITWYIEQLDLKIKPMMNHADMTIDALSVFYHEFVKYSGGDGSGLGIVLTPQHLTEFMCDVVGVNKNSRVVDICCGSGAFLVTAMSKMIKNANPQEIKLIKNSGLFGIELDMDLFTLAVANMIIRKDGKSNIYHGDCFDNTIIAELKNKNINIGLMNPPYSQKDYCELEFVEKLLEILVIGGRAAVVVPMSCAIGTKFKEVRERLFKKHTLKAVFTMPDDIFTTSGTNVCVMVWEAHCSHDSSQETFFGYYKDDGFQKRKKLGRIDVNNRWPEIEAKWLRLYRNMEVKVGLSSKACVKHNDEWLCEAYMETDYSTLKQEDFQQTVNDYLAYLVKKGDVYERK